MDTPERPLTDRELARRAGYLDEGRALHPLQQLGLLTEVLRLRTRQAADAALARA